MGSLLGLRNADSAQKARAAFISVWNASPQVYRTRDSRTGALRIFHRIRLEADGSLYEVRPFANVREGAAYPVQIDTETLDADLVGPSLGFHQYVRQTDGSFSRDERIYVCDTGLDGVVDMGNMGSGSVSVGDDRWNAVQDRLREVYLQGLDDINSFYG